MPGTEDAAKTAAEKGSGEKPLAKREELDQVLSGAPIDYSFKNLATLGELQNERPRALRVGRAPKRGPTKKFLTRSIWLNNNNLENFKNLDALVNELLEMPEELGWLDLSFNNISDIDDSITHYPKLKILYLHGNNINCFEALDKLQSLCYLRSLTLHGNPIEALPGYRTYIIHKFPQVVNLDFSPIVPSERTACIPPGMLKGRGK